MKPILLSALSLGLIVVGFALSAFGANSCVGMGVDGSAINCGLTTCQPGNIPCVALTSAKPSGPLGVAYQYCGCGGSEGFCCHLVYRFVIDTWEYTTYGDCPTCPLVGTCAKMGTGIPADPWYADCVEGGGD
jgi:hypothetical protein